MEDKHYLISDASKKVNVESHVLRYWEDELQLEIPRNELGQRYYTEFHVKLFQKIKELKEKGYQLKAIKNVLNRMMEIEKNVIVTEDPLVNEIKNTFKEVAVTETEENDHNVLAEKENDEELARQEKMKQFQMIMQQIISKAIQENNDRLSSMISNLVNDRVSNELEYLMRVSDEKEEERFRQLDETLRTWQKNNSVKNEAAVSKIPFYKKKRFGRGGKKIL